MSQQIDQKQVTNYWESEVCGTRFASKNLDDIAYAEKISAARYQCEPFIPKFAGFSINNSNKKILEIGVGAGNDFIEWLRSGAECYGIDITDAAVQEATKNVSAILKYRRAIINIEKASAAQLPFEDDTFDIVYSYGVLHHAPFTMKCLSEAIRVLKPGGQLKIMVYSTFSSTGIMLWIVHGLLKLQPFLTQEHIIFRRLESPGTKSYSKYELRKILEGFGLHSIELKKYAGSGDLLLMPPSAKYQDNCLYSAAQLLFPRNIIRRFQNVLGLALTAVATK